MLAYITSADLQNAARLAKRLRKPEKRVDGRLAGLRRLIDDELQGPQTHFHALPGDIKPMGKYPCREISTFSI